MIEVEGSSRRSFVFPATLPTAYSYYADVGRLLSYLPHVCLVHAYGPDRFRLRYNATELGVYRICIYADVQTTLEDGWAVRIHPLSSPSPVQTQADEEVVIMEEFAPFVVKKSTIGLHGILDDHFWTRILLLILD